MHLLEADSVLVEVLRALPDVPAAARLAVAALIARAERHGLAGVVHDALAGASIRGATNVEREVAWRQAARELDHAAHLEMLSTIDNALAQRGLVAVAPSRPLRIWAT